MTGCSADTFTMKRTGFKQKLTKPLKRTPLARVSPNKVKKSKPVGTRKYKKMLWTLFSKYIRERDNYTCFTCGKVATGSAMHAGHFITGATCPASLYFDEMNVHAQCYHCNINLSGNWVVYEQKMIDKYGKEITDKLKLRRTLDMGEKKDESWYIDLIAKYK